MIFRCLIALMFALALASVAHAGQADHITANGAWIRLLPANLPAGAYVTLHNSGPDPAQLTSASSPRYASVMLHESSTAGGMGRMRMAQRITVPAGGTTQLSPGGYHVMLSQAGKPVHVGDTVPLTLRFADASMLTVNFAVRSANALGPSDSP